MPWPPSQIPTKPPTAPAAAAFPDPLRLPEDDELGQKRAQLDLLGTELAYREQRLVALQSQMQAFRARYVRRVGAGCAKLDELEAQIAESEARRHPDDLALREAARRARDRATRSRAAVRQLVSARLSAPSEELRQLYRAVARRVHPDFGREPGDRNLRERLMAHANQAYQRGDERRLHGILAEYQFRPEGVDGDGTPAELARIIRRIALVRGRLDEIYLEVRETRASDLYRFKARAQAATRQGRDLLAEAGSALRARIARARRQLREMNPESARGNQPGAPQDARAAAGLQPAARRPRLGAGPGI